MIEESSNYRKALLEAQNEAIPDGLLIVDTKGKILSYNRYFNKIWNIPQAILDATDDNAALEYAMSQVSDPEAFIDRVKSLYASLNPEFFKDILHFKDGRLIERYGKPVLGEDNTFYGWVWCFRDITEQVKNERELNRQKTLYQNVLEGISDAFISFDFNWNIIYANNKAAAWGNFVRDEIMNRNVWEMFPELINSPIGNLYVQCMSSRQEGSLEYHLPDSDLWLSIKAYPTLEGMSIFATDITDNKKYERGLRESEEQLKQLSDFMPQIVWATDANGYHDFFNKRWYEFTGLSYEETKKTGWAKVLHPNDHDRTWKIWNHSLQTGDLYETEYRMRRADGDYRWLLARAMPMRDENDTIIRWFGTCTDINDQKLAADILEMKVVERTKDLQDANIYLKSMNEELRQFNYIASHDLQEPLRKIMIFSERIKEKDFDHLSESSRDFLNRMVVSSQRMATLLKDLLDFSSVNREDMFAKVDLNDIIREIETDLEHVISQKGATIRKEKLPVIHAIPLQMHQLFYNLLTNALKFVPADRKPVIQLKSPAFSQEEASQWSLPEHKQYVHLIVQDNGIGFEEEYADKIFVLFKRLHSQQTFGGTGVGLALCKKVVENHFGRIWAESIPNEGASFHIILPTY